MISLLLLNRKSQYQKIRCARLNTKQHSGILVMFLYSKIRLPLKWQDAFDKGSLFVGKTTFSKLFILLVLVSRHSTFMYIYIYFLFPKIKTSNQPCRVIYTKDSVSCSTLVRVAVNLQVLSHLTKKMASKQRLNYTKYFEFSINCLASGCSFFFVVVADSKLQACIAISETTR
jgi:hypothetical protein